MIPPVVAFQWLSTFHSLFYKHQQWNRFLSITAQVTVDKKKQRQVEEKRLEDSATVRRPFRVFPERTYLELAGGSSLPSEMKELFYSIQELSDKGFINKEGRIVRQVLEVRLLVVNGTIFLSVIDSEGIHVDPAKIESIKDWESPKTPTEIRQFLAYDEVGPQKSVKFNWGGEKEETAFQTFEQKLCSAPILALPEGSENFVVYCDASHKGLGTILMQKEKVIAYASRQLKIHEKNLTQTMIWNWSCGFASRCETLPLRHESALCSVHHKSLQHILDQKSWNMSNVECRKSRPKQLRVRSLLVMTIGLNLPVQILNAQVEARKEENYGTEDLCGMIKNLSHGRRTVVF
ncbi:putative reverse transcriptase domain-containing protein [Tanacetum coccineum]